MARLDESNVDLVAMENRTIALVRAGRLDEARAMVLSTEYAGKEKLWVPSIDSAIREIEGDAKLFERDDQRTDLLSLLGATVAIGVSLWAWSSVVLNLKRWRTDLDQALAERTVAERSLRQTHDELEVLIDERTAELGAANEALLADIEKRVETEEALRASSDQFHQLADNINDAFWIRSPDMSELRYVSPAFEQIWGRTVETLRANPGQWIEFVLPEDRARVQSQFATLRGDTRNTDLEYRIVRPDGEIRWVRVHATQVHDTEDRLISIAGIVADITESRRVTEKLRESEARFRGYFELGLIGMFISSPSKGWVEVNDELCRILGYERDALLGESWENLTHPDDLAANLANSIASSLRRSRVTQWTSGSSARAARSSKRRFR